MLGWRILRCMGGVAVVAALFAETAAAATPAEENVAVRWCSQCHAVKPGQESRNPDAPPFPLVAEDPSITAMSLRAFFRTPHENMPNIMIPPAEMDAITDYILSLKPRRP